MTDSAPDFLRPSVDLSLPAALAVVLDSAQVPMPAGALRALASTLVPDQNVTAERLGRVAAYEEQAVLKSRKTPRFCWVINEDGVAVGPRIWARGDWRLARRVMTEDAVEQQVTLALLLSQQMVEGTEAARSQLHSVAMEAIAHVLGPCAMYPPGSRDEWTEFHRAVASRQHPLGPAATTDSQNRAAERLEAQLTPYSLYFGVGEPNLVHRGEEYPPRLRLALDTEPGTPFDELVLLKVGDPAGAREVLAYVQEWDRLSDELGRSPTLQDYAERWRIDSATAHQRDAAFRSMFPTETTPHRVLRLLWSQMPSSGDFIRILGRRVVETDGPPTVINHFVNCLAFELRDNPAIGRAVYRASATFEGQDSSSPRELRRFFALCERAFRTWSAKALLAVGATASLEGLLSIGGIYDERSAGYAEQMLGEYRRQLPEGSSRRLLLSTQKALRSAAAVDALNPPATTAPYLLGVQWAAKALAEAKASEIPLDLVEEASDVTRMLDSVY